MLPTKTCTMNNYTLSRRRFVQISSCENRTVRLSPIVYRLWPIAMFRFSAIVYHPTSIIRRLSLSIVYRRSPTVYRLSPIVYRLPSSLSCIAYRPSPICYRLSLGRMPQKSCTDFSNVNNRYTKIMTICMPQAKLESQGTRNRHHGQAAE